jgi:hypothetical protein
MCAGHPPFRAGTSYGILRRITDEQPRPLREVNPNIPEWLTVIVNRLLAKSTSNRFQSAEDVGELLEQCLAHCQQPIACPLPAELRATSTWHAPKCRRWMIVGIGTLGVLLTVFALRGPLGFISSDADAKTTELQQGSTDTQPQAQLPPNVDFRAIGPGPMIEARSEIDSLSHALDSLEFSPFPVNTPNPGSQGEK